MFPFAALAVPDVPSWLIIAIILALLFVGVRELRSGEVDQNDVSPRKKRRGVVVGLVVLLLVLIISLVVWQKFGR